MRRTDFNARGGTFGSLGRNSGFTFPEVVIALLLLSLLGWNAIPALSGLAESQRLRSEARLLASTIEDLIQEARRSESKLVLSFDPHGYHAKNVDSGQTVERHTASQTVRFSVSASQPGAVHVSRDGNVQPATIRISGAHQRNCTIRLSLRGRVSTSC
jgi:prepilin-type N-terminal cleavage/methylation domain-containing protein